MGNHQTIALRGTVKTFSPSLGNVLPDDDAGRDDLWLLITNVSLAAAEPEKKMHHVIEMWAPWMWRKSVQPTSSTLVLGPI